MSSVPSRLLPVLVVLAVAAGACSSQAGSDEDGGSVGGGGKQGTGGAGSGGKAGSGGQQGSGGMAGNGGQQGSGGSPGSGGATGGASGSGGTDTVPSTGCGKTPTLKNNTSTTTFNYNKITSGGVSRQYLLRWPATTYDSAHPYRLILGFHGATGNGSQVAGASYFNLVSLSQNSTIFVAPDAVGGFWDATKDTALVDDILAQVEAGLCIDKSRVELEGFSHGGAMAYTLACARPGVFRAAVAHSPGGLPLPQKCQAVAYFTSLGQQENNLGQTMTADFFAKSAGCTVETLPRAPTGGHLCSSYGSCSAGHPVRWCPYDGDHTDSPRDSGQSKSWMPAEVWTWLSQF